MQAVIGYPYIFRSPAFARLKDVRIQRLNRAALSRFFQILGEFRDVNVFPQGGNRAQVVCH
jgi:hypothetical protein